MNKRNEKPASSIEDGFYWRRKYGAQKLLVDALVSLLEKYGSTLDLESLYKEFVLTLMGHFIVGDACYYELDESSDRLIPAVAYGRMNPRRPVARDCKTVLFLLDRNEPVRTEGSGGCNAGMSWPDEAGAYTALMAPLVLEKKLLGIVLLGHRISGDGYEDGDLDILKTLCSFSAVTFNNARLYQNAKASFMEARRLLEVRNEMVSRIDHEFRTPLTIIKAGLELMESRSELKKLGCGIAHAVVHLEELIGSLLELHGSEHPLEKNELDHVIPSEVANEVISRYIGPARERGISISLKDHTDGAKAAIWAKRAHVRTILDVLLSNAVKYSPDRSLVEIEIRRGDRPPSGRLGAKISDWKSGQELMLSRYGALIGRSGTGPASRTRENRGPHPGPAAPNGAAEYLAISVKDSGIGIPKEDLEQLGQPFRQASNSPEKGIRGKALGLALAQELLSRCGGSLYCRTARGRGSIFTVLLPLAEEP